MNPPAEKFIDTSAPTEVTQEQPAGQSSTVSDPSSLHNTVSPSPAPTLQTPSQKVDDRSDRIPPENHGGSAETEESQNGRPDASPEETLQHSPPDAGDNRSESDPIPPENHDVSVRTDEGPNETPHAGPTANLQDPPSHADHDSSGSRTDLQDTSTVDVNDKETGELSVRNFCCCC